MTPIVYLSDPYTDLSVKAIGIRYVFQEFLFIYLVILEKNYGYLFGAPLPTSNLSSDPSPSLGDRAIRASLPHIPCSFMFLFFKKEKKYLREYLVFFSNGLSLAN